MAHRISDYAALESMTRGRRPRIALILGSGLSGLAGRLDDVDSLPFGAIPGLPEPGVSGHRGELLVGNWSGVPVLVFAGRLHYYEGHPWRTVVQPIRIARDLGASILVTTNAAGGIRDDLAPGDLMAIRAHLDCTREMWWRESTSPSRGEQVRVASPYSPRLLELLPLPRGVFAQLTGPSYETPAEIRALRACGVDAVGMSTAREIQTAFDLGMECVAISCITNKAAGLGTGMILHEDVLETGRRVMAQLTGVLEQIISSA